MLRGYHHMIAERGRGFAHQFFVCGWAVHFSGIEECDTALERGRVKSACSPCHSDLRDAMSMEKRYFTSDLSSLS